MPKKASEILTLLHDGAIKLVDFRFTDVPGTWQHTTVPASAIDERTLARGIGFDGSSIRGFAAIEASDMLLRPDLSTAHVDDFRTYPTLAMICDVLDPITKTAYDRDPREIARRAEAHLASTGIADTAYFGPEAEFFIFDSIAYESEPYRTGYAIDSSEGYWNSGEVGLGHTLRRKEGYYPVPPSDHLMDLRSEMALELANWGLEVETHHHEVASGGQAEIDFKYDSLLKTADNVMAFKYVVKNVALRGGKTVTFMPKPLYGDNGSGMHCHQSLWKDGKPLFFDAGGYAECSQTMLYYIGGLLTHIDSVLAFAAPTTNSYKRLVPHDEAPVRVAFSARNRSAAIRIPTFFPGDAKAKRLEFRPPDASANPYLSFAAMLCAGIDGIERRIDPVKAGFGPIDKNIYELGSAESARLRSVPRSLDAALDALASDNDYLRAGGVFSADFIARYIASKRADVAAVDSRPHPHEFSLYYDV